MRFLKKTTPFIEKFHKHWKIFFHKLTKSGKFIWISNVVLKNFNSLLAK